MKDAGLSNSPTSAPRFEVTDEQLSAELKKWTGTTPALQPVGELLDRHWEAAFAYARLCTEGPRAAGMLTTAAFTRLFGESIRDTGPSSAWRPRLLVTVRRIAAEWDTERSRELLHPDLRAGAGDADRVAARLLPPAGRRLLSGAFQRLPQVARCLLWHVEVESEPLETPAALLGLSERDALVELRRGRERLREECLQVHRELASDQECHRYLRMLDVTYRRGAVKVDPDLAAHLARCKHCNHTAGQLSCFNEGLGVALAEAVLGWGAHDYVATRADPAAPAAEEQPPTGMTGESFADPGAPAAPAGGHRATARRTAAKAARRAAARRRNVAAAALTVGGLVVLPMVLWSSLSGGGDTKAEGARPSGSPETGRSTSDAEGSWIGTGASADGTLEGRLHNLDSGLCVSVVGGRTAEGAEVGLRACSSAAGQLWAYETDGALRSAADPNLCLDSRLGYSVQLAPCTGATGEGARSVRYDFTLQGTLVSRRDQDLALAPAATDGSGALVLKTRSDSRTQRWVFDTSKADLQMEAVNWDAETAAVTPPSAAPAPRSAPRATPAPTPSAAPASATPAPAASDPVPSGSACSTDPSACGYPGGWGYGNGGRGWGYGDGGGHNRH
ncbi:RICIN domain-containing protein [Streptomyces sp. ACT015]|uniref:RICIN domain-containing protein n=1 Tax=Streptomyces sp. ACT015 TaxID=3134807 RepID=UPI003D17D801